MESIKRLARVAKGLGLDLVETDGEDRANGFRCSIFKRHSGGYSRIGEMCRNLREARQILSAFSLGHPSCWAPETPNAPEASDAPDAPEAEDREAHAHT